MAELPIRGTQKLRDGRESIAGGTYFVTMCVANRAESFSDELSAVRIVSVMEKSDREGDTTLLALVVMADHIHWLFKLGSRLTFDRVIAKTKTLGRAPDSPWRWQTNVFEHRLRQGDDAENFAFYMFMNPYRAGIISHEARWPWWCGPSTFKWAFEQHLENTHGIPPEWPDRMKFLARQIPRSAPLSRG